MRERKVSGCRCSRLLLEFAVAVVVAAALGLFPASAAAQVAVREHDGKHYRWFWCRVPGATVNIKDEATGLALSAVTDSTGTYTIRNITGGTYTLRASLQGFKEFVQTGIPVTAGSIVRINGKLEIGALSESVTVTTEAAVLKTDKAGRQHRAQAGRRRQSAAESVPELSVLDEPRARRDAAGVPERPDRHARPLAVGQRQRHQPQQQRHPHRRRRQHQRVAAASRRLCRAGRND